MSIQEIKDKNNNIIALFYPKKIKANGTVRFLTPPNYPLQIGLIEHNKKKIIPPHIHRDLYYDVNTTQEFLYVEKGKNIKVILYDSKWGEVKKIFLSSGDSILFVSGGHSLKIPKGCRIFEVKQGPYPGDKLAKIFKD